MPDTPEYKRRIDPKAIERLEDDWDYDIDSPDTEGDYQRFNFSFKGLSDFVIRVIRTPLRTTSNNIPNHSSDEDDNDEYLSPDEPQGTFFQQLISLPGKLIFSPLSLLSLFYVSWLHTDELDHDLSKKERSSKLFGRMLILLTLILVFPFRLLFAVLSVLAGFFDGRKTEALFILPSFLMVSLFSYVIFYQLTRTERIQQRYQFYAVEAMKENDFARAKTFFERLKLMKDFEPNEQYQWATILNQTGESDRAEQIINSLAPEDSVGFPPAHTLKALSLARAINTAEGRKQLASLHWHLQNADGNSEQLSQAWVNYYLVVEEWELAAEKLEIAAQNNPLLYESLYRLYVAQGRKADSEFALKKADKAFQEYLKENPINPKARIGWAWVASNMKDYAKAEAILLQGKRINNDGAINRALSDFYILQQIRAQQNGAELSQQLQLLNQAQKADPSYARVYSSMMEIFVRGGRDEESRREIRTKLQQVVASEQSSPMAHFALSNIIFQDGDREKAIFHLEQAYQMDSSLISVMNNLAWMLAHSEPPDLDRALDLATAAVSRVPKDARCRDTLGTVLMKLGRNKEAIPHLELALSGAANKQAVHQKLSATYKSLGMNELSQIHAKASLNPK
ncbi:hypothetical protein OAU26_00550 [Mariniblastus sp.]|nr:hypothetical protein [Mariniblastus sp.]